MKKSTVQQFSMGISVPSLHRESTDSVIYMCFSICVYIVYPRIKDAMILANNCGELKMTDAIWTPSEYTELTDYQVLQKIRFSKEPRLQEVCIRKFKLLHLHFFLIKARRILENVEKRKLYKCIGYFILVCCLSVVLQHCKDA